MKKKGLYGCWTANKKREQSSRKARQYMQSIITEI